MVSQRMFDFCVVFTMSLPWIPEAPKKTEKWDLWFRDDKAWVCYILKCLSVM